jgi:hypothetical protein
MRTDGRGEPRQSLPFVVRHPVSLYVEAPRSFLPFVGKHPVSLYLLHSRDTPLVSAQLSSRGKLPSQFYDMQDLVWRKQWQSFK